MENKKPDEISGIDHLIDFYKQLGTGEKADLRRQEDYFPVQQTLAFYRVKTQYEKLSKQKADNKNFPAISDNSLACLLIFWRDRKSSEPDLKSSSKSLGALLVAGNETKIKKERVTLGRFKRVMSAETLEDGFNALRPILKLLRHERLNWKEISNYLAALNSNNHDWQNRVKKEISNKYFKTLEENNLLKFGE